MCSHVFDEVGRAIHIVVGGQDGVVAVSGVVNAKGTARGIVELDHIIGAVAPHLGCRVVWAQSDDVGVSARDACVVATAHGDERQGQRNRCA